MTTTTELNTQQKRDQLVAMLVQDMSPTELADALVEAYTEDDDTQINEMFDSYTAA